MYFCSAVKCEASYLMWVWTSSASDAKAPSEEIPAESQVQGSFHSDCMSACFFFPSPSKKAVSPKIIMPFWSGGEIGPMRKLIYVVRDLFLPSFIRKKQYNVWGKKTQNSFVWTQYFYVVVVLGKEIAFCCFLLSVVSHLLSSCWGDLMIRPLPRGEV